MRRGRLNKRGLLFIVLIAILYWGYYFIKPVVIPERSKRPGVRRSKLTEKERMEMIHSANLNLLETSIYIFQQKEKRYPRDLSELVEKEYLSGIPDSGSRPWEYNPETGEVK
jgi:hypothetical protein